MLRDTNALLWVLTADKPLGSSAQTHLAQAAPVHFSAVSVLEITMKEMLGWMDTPGDVADGARKAGLVELPLRADHASGLKELPSLSRHDSSDRMLLSQAQLGDLLLLTSDCLLLDLGLKWILKARQ